MKKTLLLIVFLFAGLVGFGQKTTIMLLDSTIVEEFRTVDKNQTDIVSYRRLTKKQVREYIDKIQIANDLKAQELEFLKDEENMHTQQLNDVKERRKTVSDEIADNKRRIKEFRKILNR